MNQALLFTEPEPVPNKSDANFLFELRFGLIRIRAWRGAALPPSNMIRLDLRCTYKGREIYQRGETWIPTTPETIGSASDKARAAEHILRVPDALWTHASQAQRDFADSKAADAARDACWTRNMKAKGWR